MKENTYEHNQNRPMKRMYASLGIWIFLYLSIISAGFYMIAVDFSFESHQQVKSQSKDLSKSVKSPTNEPLNMIKQNSTDKPETMIADDKGLQSIDEK